MKKQRTSASVLPSVERLQVENLQGGSGNPALSLLPSLRPEEGRRTGRRRQKRWRMPEARGLSENKMVRFDA